MHRFFVILIFCSGLTVLGALPPQEDVAGAYADIVNIVISGTVGGPEQFGDGTFVEAYNPSDPTHQKLTMVRESQFDGGRVLSFTSDVDEYLEWYMSESPYNNIVGLFYYYDSGAERIDVTLYGGPIQTLDMMMGDDWDIEYMRVNGIEDTRFESFWDLAEYM